MKMPTEIVRLELPDAAEFSGLTYPRMRYMLTGEDTDESEDDLRLRIAFGVWSEDRTPIGLALLSADHYGQRRLNSVMVDRAYRRLGLGLQLLQRCEQAAREHGTNRLTAFHVSRMANPVAFEGLLEKAGWNRPEMVQYRVAGPADWSLRAAQDWAPFFRRLDRSGCTFSTWDDLTDSDRDRINQLVEHHLAPEEKNFAPWKTQEDASFIPQCSVVIRRQGEVVGWIQCQESPLKDHYYYVNGYVLPELRRGGWLIYGVIEVCRLQTEAFGPKTISVYETAADNEGMFHFMRDRLETYRTWMDMKFRSEKSL